MTTYTQDQAVVLFDAQEQIKSFYRSGMKQGIDPEIIAGALALELEGLPALAKDLHDCMGPGCENVTDDPRRDAEQVKWMGEEHADTYCSEDCENNASEAYWMHRWAVGA